MRGILIGMIVMTAATGALAQSNPLDAKAQGMTSADAAQLVQLGDLYVEATRYDDAKATYKSALKLEAKFGEAQFGLARILMAKGKLEKAKKACRVLTRKNKTGTVGEVCSGWVWLSFDRSARAVDEFNKAVAKGDAARGQTGLAEAARRRSENEKAIAGYNTALAAGAGYVAKIGLGMAKEATGDNTGAAASFKEAISMEPASCDAHFNYGRISGNSPDAISHLRTAVTIRPDWPEAHQILADALLTSSDLPGAKAAYEKSIEQNPKRGTAHLGLGKTLYTMGDTDGAKKELEAAVELVPNLVDAYMLMSDIAYASGDKDAALDALEKAKNMAPGVVDVYLHTAETYVKMGRLTSANSFLKQAITMNTRLSIAHSMLGDIACERLLFNVGNKHYDDALAGDMHGVVASKIQSKKAACKSKH